MASADVQILGTGSKAAPLDYVLPSGSELLLKAVRADFDGTNASGAFLPALEIISDAGHSVGVYPTDVAVAAGASASVSFAPFLRNTATATAGLFSANCIWRGVEITTGPTSVVPSGAAVQMGFSASFCSENVSRAFPVPQGSIPEFADTTNDFNYSFMLVVPWPSFAAYRRTDVQITSGAGNVWGWETVHRVFGATTPDCDTQVVTGIFTNEQLNFAPFAVVVTLFQTSGVDQILGGSGGLPEPIFLAHAVSVS